MENEEIRKVFELSIIIFSIVLIIVLLNIHIETYEDTKIKVVEINGERDVYVGIVNNSVYCDTTFEFCKKYVNCQDDMDITYEWKSNMVGDPDSEYLSFFGHGVCIIKYPAKSWRLTWL